MRASPTVFLLILIALATSSSPLKPPINTLVPLTDCAQEVSTIVLSFNYIGGGIGYVTSSLLLRA